MPCRASCKISWKHLFLGFFLVICQTGWRILLFLDCFFTFIWPLKVIKTLFTYFNHQIKSITSLNCKLTLIQFVFLRGDSALWYMSLLLPETKNFDFKSWFAGYSILISFLIQNIVHNFLNHSDSVNRNEKMFVLSLM